MGPEGNKFTIRLIISNNKTETIAVRAGLTPPAPSRPTQNELDNIGEDIATKVSAMFEGMKIG